MNRQRGREEERQRDREVERQRGREVERQRGREIERQRGREKERQRGREVERQRDREIARQRDREVEMQRDREVEMQRDLLLSTQRGKEDFTPHYQVLWGVNARFYILLKKQTMNTIMVLFFEVKKVVQTSHLILVFHEIYLCIMYIHAILLSGLPIYPFPTTLE